MNYNDFTWRSDVKIMFNLSECIILTQNYWYLISYFRSTRDMYLEYSSV